ncbi:MAG: hypothetical protein WD076_04815 [Parvularculaceae bacterium]
MKKLIFALVGVFALLGIPALGSHAPAKVEEALSDGGLRHSESFKTNYYIYKSIGGETWLKGKEKKRKWWCAWLCKRRVDKKAELITIHNTYYAEVSPGFFSSIERLKTCANAASCKQKEWSIGVGVKLPFPGESGSPTPSPTELPIDGVITRHTIKVDGQEFSIETSYGKHPAPPPPVIL